MNCSPGMHVLPAGEHRLAEHAPVADIDHLLVELERQPMCELLDGTGASVGVDRRAGKHKASHLVGKAAREHGAHPAALAKADQVDSAAEIVDHDIDLGQVLVDVEIAHGIGGGLPVVTEHTLETGAKQGLDRLWPLA